MIWYGPILLFLSRALLPIGQKTVASNSGSDTITVFLIVYKVEKMCAFSVLTPYYEEEVIYSLKDLNTPNEDGITTLYYLQRVFPGWPPNRTFLDLSLLKITLDLNSNYLPVNIWFADDWKHFKERFKREDGSKETDQQFIDRMSGLDDVAGGGTQKKNDAKDDTKLGDEDGLELCLWASYRGQTLARTVRGMMYYERSDLQVSFLVSLVNLSVSFLLVTNSVKNY